LNRIVDLTWEYIILDKVPTLVTIVISACAFAEAHLAPREFPQLVTLGELSC